jgi:hypothetical protein
MERVIQSYQRLLHRQKEGNSEMMLRIVYSKQRREKTWSQDHKVRATQVTNGKSYQSCENEDEYTSFLLFLQQSIPNLV